MEERSNRQISDYRQRQRKRKQEIMNRIHIFILLLFISVLEAATARIWQDDFVSEVSTPAEQTENWQLKGNESIWNVKDDLLRAELRPRKQVGVIFEQLEFVALPGPYADFTITLETVGVEAARFGIALGKIFKKEPMPEPEPQRDIEDIGYYLFFTNDMGVARNASVQVGAGQRWNTDTLEQMELRFKAGRFQLWADGDARLDFEDANFYTIHRISFVLAGFVPNNGNVGKAWVDAFTFETPSLNVSQREKLTTRWAAIKQDR